MYKSLVLDERLMGYILVIERIQFTMRDALQQYLARFILLDGVKVRNFPPLLSFWRQRQIPNLSFVNLRFLPIF